MSESDRYFFARSFAITAMNKSCLIKPFPQSAQAARIFSRLRLFHGLLSVEPFLHCGHRADQHVAVLAELVHVGDRTVAGNDFRIGGNLPDDHVERLNQTADAAAVRLVDERERPSEVLVAHVHGVALSEPDHRVAVGVPYSWMDDADLLTVRPERDLLSWREICFDKKLDFILFSPFFRSGFERLHAASFLSLLSQVAVGLWLGLPGL